MVEGQRSAPGPEGNLMKVSLRSQFYVLVVPFVGAMVALLLAMLALYLAVHRDVLEVERELAFTVVIQAFHDSFARQTQEYVDYIMTGDQADAEEAVGALAATRQDLAAWRRLAMEDGLHEREVVNRITAGHARVATLGATILRLRRDGRQPEAAAILLDEVVPLTATMSRDLDLSSHEHHDRIFGDVARIAGAIGSSRLLQWGGMLKRIEELESHVNEVLYSSAYKHAIDREVQSYWFLVLSKGVVRSDAAADHARVLRAFAGWRQAVARYQTGRPSEQEPIDELGMVDEVHREYLALHADGGRVLQWVAQDSYPQATELLERSLELDDTAIAKTMDEYTVHESAIAGTLLVDLRREVVRSRRMLLAGGLLILSIALGVPWVLSRRIVAPIRDLQQAALRIGRGDLETRIVVPSTTELASLATTFNDMTRELKASRNKDLETSEERFRLAARATRDMIWDWDVRTDQFWLDERFRGSLESPGAGISRSRLLESIHPDDRQRVHRGLEAAMTGAGDFWSDEHRFRRLDGTYAQMSNRAFIVREADGTAVRAIGAMMDITERKTAEQAIAALHRQKAMILESVGDGVVGLDGDGNITAVNRAAAVMLGHDKNDLLGTSMRHVLHHDEEETSARWTESLICTTLVEGTLQSSELEQFRRADGSTFPAGYVSSPMCDDDGHVIGAVVTFRDMTQKHEVDRLKSQFVSTVSHELRTPLTSIRGALGLLSGGLLGTVSAKGQRMLEIAVSNTDRLVRLINDILDVERIESEVMKMGGDVVDGLDLMKRAAEGIQSIADGAGVRIVIEPATALILGDADRLNQTLTNLLGNAIKFSPRDTTVTMGLHAAGGKCTFRIADQGRGVPASKLEMIFARFQQVDASDSRDKGGSGLGLAICRSIVDAHGGRIWAERNEPAGTVFQFTIPSAPVAVAVPDAGPMRRTLVVCQESGSAMPGIVTMMEGQGFHVLRCVEADVVARVAELQPDAVVLDLASKGGRGWRIVEALKSEPDTRNVPIVVATLQLPESREHYAAAIASWVREPFGCEDLLDAVSEACRAPSIVVVEDDVDLARVMTEILQTHGIRTFRAANGREAVDLCQQHEPSLIVLDVILPDLDGFGVVSSLRESATLRRVPLLVYSGLEFGAADQERLRLGPTEFLTKSRASLEEFESHVVRLLDTITTTKVKELHAA
jgi:PAS domain S-box-containing protein